MMHLEIHQKLIQKYETRMLCLISNSTLDVGCLDDFQHAADASVAMCQLKQPVMSNVGFSPPSNKQKRKDRSSSSDSLETQLNDKFRSDYEESGSDSEESKYNYHKSESDSNQSNG